VQPPASDLSGPPTHHTMLDELLGPTTAPSGTLWSNAACRRRSASPAMSWSGPSRPPTPYRRGPGRPGRSRSGSATASNERGRSQQGPGQSRGRFLPSLGREGAKGPWRSRWWAGRGPTAWPGQEGEEPGPPLGLLLERPPEEPEPTRYYQCDLPEELRRKRRVQIGRGRGRIELDDQQRKEKRGRHHCEGRSGTGCHHHVTWVMWAHLFLRFEQQRRPRQSKRDPARDAA
jgi:hypothetical protein